ncbi:hypothetical protein BK122_26015 [Paenibacillus pabuli]|nr:hypothetical protein BK122_26015 [Paenibacillus pabuli]
MATRWKVNVIPYMIRFVLISCSTLMFFYAISRSFQNIDFVFRGWGVQSDPSLIICLFLIAFLFVFRNRFPLPPESRYVKMKNWMSVRLTKDVQILLYFVIGLALFYGTILVMQGNGIRMSQHEWINDFVMYLSAFLLSSLLLCFAGEYGRAGIRLISDRAALCQTLNELWLRTTIHMIRDELKHGTPPGNRIIKTLIVCFVSQFVLLIIAFMVEVFRFPILLLILACSVIILGQIVRIIHGLQGVTQAASAMALGRMDVQLPQQTNGMLDQLTMHMNDMKQGIQSTVEKRVKSERMKSELITNVSHDLKTPLTSLVSYVDLLKRNEGTAEEKAEYIEVLQRKTKRLSVLVEDLFEAAKMASGDVELHLEQVDVAALLHQALAEYSESIIQSGLIFRVSSRDSPMYAHLDGKRTWRVFENLLGNVIKYGMKNSRVFIDLSEDDVYVILCIKNVSTYEMQFAADEIFERFKRGDHSRSEEGSGLGLSIAKSIVELHGGRVNIEIDGDLFKVTVHFPK